MEHGPKREVSHCSGCSTCSASCGCSSPAVVPLKAIAASVSLHSVMSAPLGDVTAQKWATGGWPLWEPAQRSAGHCPYEAALPRVTCCPPSPRYLSLADTPSLFLSRPLLFHLPIRTPPPLSLARPLRTSRQPLLLSAAKSCWVRPSLSRSCDIQLQGPPLNDSGRPRSPSEWNVQNGRLTLTKPKGGSSLWCTERVITSSGWSQQLDFLPPQFSLDHLGHTIPFH